jgi:ribosomal protein L34E
MDNHFRRTKDPENALVTRELWFANLPAVMRIRVTTPNVMKALRKRDPGAAKPYNFAISPILIQPPRDCTLVAPFSKRPEKWLKQDFTEINSGDTVKLFTEYKGTKLLPQTLSGVVWRHYLHPEDKSLAPEGECCGPYTSGLLLRRPIQAMLPFRFIGKEIERKAQEGEDISIAESRGPIQYQARQTAKTRAADAGLILRAKRFSVPRIMRNSGKSQHAVERFLSGARVHPKTRAAMAQAVEKLEREAQGKTSSWNILSRDAMNGKRRHDLH